MRGALYLRFRPQVFSELVGQDHIKKTLLNALKENKVSHAYLFCGPRGTGKTSTARLLAKAINCGNSKNGEPCNKCESCVEITENKALDLIEIDAASNRGIDEIRDLREKVKVAPAKSKYKIFIIDEVHMLTKEAFNALLKTLEEPPKHVIFILATTEAHKVPVTIISRCQRFDFHLIDNENLKNKLEKIAKKEKIDLDSDSLELIVRKARGSYRDGESLLDQLSAFGGQKITFEMVKNILGLPDFEEIKNIADSLIARDYQKSISKLEKLLDQGEDAEQLLLGLIEFFRNLLIVEIDNQGFGEEEIKILEKLAKEIDNNATVVGIINNLSEALNQLKTTEVDRLPIEICFWNICEGGAQSLPEAIVAKPTVISQIKSRIPEPVKKIVRPVRDKIMPKVSRVAESLPRRQAGASGGEPKKLDSDSLNQIKTNWEAILDEVKLANHSIRAFLQAGEPTSLDQSGILLIIYRYDFHKERMDEIKNREVVEKAIEKITGLKVRLRGEVEQNEPSKGVAPQRPNKEGNKADVTAVFGGGKEIS